MIRTVLMKNPSCARFRQQWPDLSQVWRCMDIEEWLIQLSEGYDGVVMAVVSSHEERDYECPIPLTGRDAIHLWLTVWGTLKDSVAVAVCDWWNPQATRRGLGIPSLSRVLKCGLIKPCLLVCLVSAIKLSSSLPAEHDYRGAIRTQRLEPGGTEHCSV